MRRFSFRSSERCFGPGAYGVTLQKKPIWRHVLHVLWWSCLLTPLLAHAQGTSPILVFPDQFLFTGVEGTSTLPPQTFGILNPGTGSVNWTIQGGRFLNTIGSFEEIPGASLSFSSTSGTSQANSAQIPRVEVTVGLNNVRAGIYVAEVRITTEGAANPLVLAIVLSVLPAGSDPGMTVQPSSLIFTGEAGSAAPATQAIRLSRAAPGVLEAGATAFTFRGGPWLGSTPASVSVSPADPKSIDVQASMESLAPGSYSGAVTLLFGNRTSRTVNVLLVVIPRSGAAACVPRALSMQSNLGSNAGVVLGFQNTLEAIIKDDCGNLIPNATVVASFSNGNPAVTLTSQQNGTYRGTWVPPQGNPATVTVTFRASGTVLPEAQLSIAVHLTQVVPIVEGAGFAAGKPIAPGSIVSVFGNNLAPAFTWASSLPLPTTLDGSSLKIGGLYMRLFVVTPNQINAFVPTEIPVNTQQQVVLETAAGSRLLGTVSVAEAQPGLFAMNQAGSGPGAIMNENFILNSGANPARVGGIVAIFCNGLGLTDPPVPTGITSPRLSPLAIVRRPVAVTIGGLPAAVFFAGLAPGFISLFQVNVQIPVGITPGPAVPVTITVAGATSNTVTMAIQ